MFVRLSVLFLFSVFKLGSLLGQVPYDLPTWSTEELNFDLAPAINIYFDDHTEDSISISISLQTIIDDFQQSDSLLIIHFSDKEYFFDQTIELKSNIHLSGNNSQFAFDLEGYPKECLSIKGDYSTDSIYIDAVLSKGDEVIALPQSENFQTGDLIYLQEKDNSIISSDWALGSSGQLLEVSYVSTGHIHLQTPLRRNYENNLGHKLILIYPIENVRISGIRVNRLDSTTQQCSNIRFRFARNCQIDCIESYSCNFAHVSIEYSNNIHVQNSFFKDGHTYVSGGRAYGIVLHFASGECLIENNIFEHLRHSVLLQAGANGNIIAYNYSKDPYWEQFPFPANSAGEFVLHGNYPYANLFEGNVMSNLVADESHGLNGPDNTFFRNRIDNGFILILPSISQVHLINNIAQDILYSNGSPSGIIETNLLNDILIGDDPAMDYGSSLYLNGAPNYFSNFSYPPFYPNISAFNNKLSAQDRYTKGYKTECAVPLSTNSQGELSIKKSFSILPNPCRDYFYIDSHLDISSIQLIRSDGKIQALAPSKRQSTQDLKSGVYFVSIQYQNGLRAIQKLLVL